MDTLTGRLYDDIEDLGKDIAQEMGLEGDIETLKKNAQFMAELETRALPLNQQEYEQAKKMNRAERRRWARENKRR